VIVWSEGSGVLNTGERNLEWAAFGPVPGKAPVIVLLHEGLGCVARWRDFPDQLSAATGLPVFAYSRGGYGQSDPVRLPRPLDYMTREATRVLPVVLDQIGAAAYILMGHSDGATIAAEYAGRIEDHRVRGLILMAPHFFTEPMGLASIEQAKVAYETGDLRERLARHHRDADNAFRGWNDAWLDPDFVKWDVSDVIDYFRVPVLAIQGQDDQYGTRAQIDAIESRSYAPVDVLMPADCRHSPHIDQPEAVLDAVAEFTGRLRRIEAAPAAGS